MPNTLSADALSVSRRFRPRLLPTFAMLSAVAIFVAAANWQGRLAVPSAAYVELKANTTTGPVWQNLDPARFAAATGLAVLPVVIEQTGAQAHPDGLMRDWPAPDFGVEKHWIYMMQWYAFAGLAVVFWLVLNFRKPRTPR